MSNNLKYKINISGIQEMANFFTLYQIISKDFIFIETKKLTFLYTI